MSYTVIEHTADTGIRVRASSLASLLTEASRGMFEQITDLEKVEEAVQRPIKLSGLDESDLLINTLRELLYLFTGEGMLIKKLAVESIKGFNLTGRAEGEMYDPEKHPIRTELKAVTYAGGDVRKKSAGFEATVIFDI